MGGVVAVVAGHAGKQVLVALTGHEIAVIEGRAAEIRQKAISRPVHPHLVAALHLHCIKHR